MYFYKARYVVKGLTVGVVKATSWGAPTQGSNLDVTPFTLWGTPLQFSFKKRHDMTWHGLPNYNLIIHLYYIIFCVYKLMIIGEYILLQI
jgi:hypothetical protein